MKSYLSLIFFIAITAAQAQEIEWMSMNEALEKQDNADQPKKIFMDVYTDWCGPCKMLDKKTFHNPDVAQFINDHFYPVKFNAEGTEKINYHDFTYTNPNYKEGKKGATASTCLPML